MAFIKDICTRVLFVDKGKIIGDGTAQQVFKQSDNERIKEFFSKVL